MGFIFDIKIHSHKTYLGQLQFFGEKSTINREVIALFHNRFRNMHDSRRYRLKSYLFPGYISRKVAQNTFVW